KNNTLVIIDTPKIEISKVAVPIVAPEYKVYKNAETDKLQVLTENEGKAGIYLWTHKESGKKYIGSAVDLSKRLSKYYSPLELKVADNYISRAIICHSHSAFSLSILEYIDISHLSKDKAKALILEREQYHLDKLLPEYHILKVAGSSLGYKHSAELIAKFSGENHPLFGKSPTEQTLLKMSETLKGGNNPMDLGP